MASKSFRLEFGSIYQKKPGGNYHYRFQLEGHRKSVCLNTRNRAAAIKEAEQHIPIVQAPTAEIIAAHVKQARGMSSPVCNLSLNDVWDYYSQSPDRATPATLHEHLQYRGTLEEFIRFAGDRQLPVSSVTPSMTDRFADYLRNLEIAVATHNRKIKRLRRIFSTLTSITGHDNPFTTALFRREREEQELDRRRLAFSREQEQQLLDVLDDDNYQIRNKPEVKVLYHLGMYTGQRLKDCVLLQWNNVDLARRMIRVRQFKTGKLVTIPIANRLLEVLQVAETWRVNDYVCPLTAVRYKQIDRHGKTIGDNLVNHEIMNVIKWIGLEPSIPVPGRKRRLSQYGFHSLRHSFASHCAEADIPKPVLLSILGTDVG